MLKLSLFNLSRHKLRTLLSVLGIALGVASLIVLVAIVDGIRFDIEEAFSQAQGINVTPISATDPTFTSFDESWVSKIEKVRGVKNVVPNVMQVAKSIDGDSMDYLGGARIVGIDLSRQASGTGSGFQGELLEGRDFRGGDKGVVLIGEVVKDTFHKFVGSNIKINGVDFRVVGVYTTGSELLDTSILMPIEDAREITNFPSNQISLIRVELFKPTDDQVVVDRIQLLYGKEVRAQSVSDFSDQFGLIFSSITALVLVIASIASIVAAVGIINTMLMSVLERFGEIGALKAVGWNNDNIIQMILYEALFIGVLGGIMGIALGFAGKLVVELFGLTVLITPVLLAGSFLGAVFVGVVGGIYPAFIASRMNPVEALRAE